MKRELRRLYITVWLMLVSGFVLAAECPPVSQPYRCNFDNILNTYNGVPVGQSDPEGTVFGEVTTSFNYTCRFNNTSSSDEYVIVGLTSETSVVSADKYSSTLEGVYLSAGTDATSYQIGGVSNRIELSVLGPRKRYSGCWSGSYTGRSIKVFIGAETLALEPGPYQVNFLNTTNFVTSRYNTGPGRTYIMGPAPDIPIEVGAASCRILSPDIVVDFGSMSVSDFGRVGGTAPSKQLNIALDCARLNMTLGYRLDSLGDIYIDKSGGVVGLQGGDESAKGVGYRILDLTQGTAQPVKFGETSEKFKPSTDTGLNLNFDVQPIQTGHIGAGTANAVVIITLSYP